MVFGQILHPADHNLRSITKTEKDFAKKLHLEDIKSSLKLKTFTQLQKKFYWHEHFQF